MRGEPIEVRFSSRMGRRHASSFLRERRIVFDAALRRAPGEFRRILVHEVYHFAWLRAGNSRRCSWEQVLADELRRGAKGELGWSAEWRKEKLRARDRQGRSRRWREYACESFCDTAAWIFSCDGRHDEFTLAASYRRARRQWFAAHGLDRRISV